MAELQRESTVFLLSPRRCPEPLEVRDRPGAEYRCLQRSRFRRFQAVAHETIAQAQADEYVVRGGFRFRKDRSAVNVGAAFVLHCSNKSVRLTHRRVAMGSEST